MRDKEISLEERVEILEELVYFLALGSPVVELARKLGVDSALRLIKGEDNGLRQTTRQKICRQKGGSR